MKQFSVHIGDISNAIIGIVATTVCAGWVLNVQWMKTFHISETVMQFSTAIAFLISTVLIWSMKAYQQKKSPLSELLLPWSTLVILLLMSSLLFSLFLGVNPGLDNLFIDMSNSNSMFTNSLPSIGTMVGFLVMAVAGLLILIPNSYTSVSMGICSLCITVIGALAITGHVLNLSMLYFSFENFSYPMAPATAVLFMCIGGTVAIDHVFHLE